MDNASFTVDFSCIKALEDFKKEFRASIIENGLDEPIIKSINELKVELFDLINERIKAVNTIPGQPTDRTNTFDQEIISIPKSEHELIKFLTGADPEKYNRAKGFSELEDSKILFGYKQKYSDSANRVTLKMKIGPNDTVEAHHAKAVEFINNAVFALPGDGGKVEFYINPGIDLSKYIKIKCSTVGGFSDNKPKKGMSPSARFEKDKVEKGYAQWTIFQDNVNEIIRQQFIKLNDIFEPIKNGDTEQAVQKVQSYGRNKTVEHLKEQVEKLHKKEQLTPTVEAYSNIVTLINNLKLEKKITDPVVEYYLTSSYSPGKEEEKDFFQEIRKAISFWMISNEAKWFEAVIKKVEKLIKRFTDR